MRIYLDNCCYNRPFDDQSQLRVRLETEAKLAVQLLMRNHLVEYVWSDMLANEVEESPYWEQRERIESWVVGASTYVATTPEIEQRAEIIMALGIKASDAIHIASAAFANCDWFLTVDKGILKKIGLLEQMRIANPLDYIKETMP